MTAPTPTELLKQVVLNAWHERFPNNMYAWPGAPDDFAAEAVKAIQAASVERAASPQDVQKACAQVAVRVVERCDEERLQALHDLALSPTGKERILDHIDTRKKTALDVAHSIRALIPPVERAEVAGEAVDPNFKWGIDYGKDILKDINQLAHAKGTGSIHRDVLRRAYREIKRLAFPPRSEGVRGSEVRTVEVDDLIERLQNWNHGCGKTMIVSETIDMLNRMRGAAQASPMLWCCHARGPDDVYAAPDYATALAWSDTLNALNFDTGDARYVKPRGFKNPSLYEECLIKAVPAPWPHNPEAHAEDLPRSIEGFAIPSADGGHAA